MDLASSIAHKLGIDGEKGQLQQRSKKTTIRVQAQLGLSTTTKVKMKSSSKQQGKSNLSRFNMFKAKGMPIAPYDDGHRQSNSKKKKKAGPATTPDVVVLL